MPSKKSSTPTGADAGPSTPGKAPSDGEMRFVKAVMENMVSKPDVNWDSVASTLGLKDAKCARERYRQISNKFGWNDKGSATPARGKAAAAGAAATGGPPDTPTKVTKRTGKVGAKRGRKKASPKLKSDEDGAKVEDEGDYDSGV